MNQEVKHFTRVNANLALIVEDMRMKQHGMQNEAQAVKTKIGEQEKFKRQFKDDILECLNYLSDAKQLKKQVIRLHKIYVKNEGSPNEVGEADFHVEQIARRQQLEGQLSQLKNKLDQQQAKSLQQSQTKAKENVSLIQVINELTTQYHNI